MIKVQKQLFPDVLKNFTIFTRKYLCWNLFVLQLQSSSPATILKSNSSTCVFLWILPNFKEHLFWKTPMNGCFWNLMKVLFDHEILSFWTCYEEHISCAFYKVIAPTQVVKALVVKALDSQSSGPVFKTIGWLQGWLSLSSFRGR